METHPLFFYFLFLPRLGAAAERRRHSCDRGHGEMLTCPPPGRSSFRPSLPPSLPAYIPFLEISLKSLASSFLGGYYESLRH